MKNIIVKGKLIALSALVVCAILALTAAPAYGKAVGTTIQPPSQEQNNNPGSENQMHADYLYIDEIITYDQNSGEPQGNPDVPGVPEPTTLILFGAGLAGLAIRKRRNS